MKPLRIAHVTATFPPYHGGTGNVCAHNARELARRGHHVTVFTAGVPGAPAAEQRDGYQVRRLRPLVRVGNAPVLPGLLSALRGFDIVHLHYPFFGGELTALAAARQGMPLVITYHQDVLLKGIAGGTAWLLAETIGRLALRSASRVLYTTSDYAAASASRRLLRGRECSIGDLPNGVDPLRFQPGSAPRELRAQLQIPSAERIALLVAGLDRAHAFKGVDVFLAALTRLPPVVHGVVVGDGELRLHYRARASAMGLDHRVHFVQRVTDDALPDYYRAADVTVLPSVTMGEAFGLVLLESLACATPVIASRLPGVRVVVRHGEDGLLVPPGDAAALADALHTMLSDEPRRLAMGAAGRTRVATIYAWEQIGARLEQVYAEVLDLRVSHPRRASAKLVDGGPVSPAAVPAGEGDHL